MATLTALQGKSSIFISFVYALTDSGATYSFVSIVFAKYLPKKPVSLFSTLVVETPTKNIMSSNFIYKFCIVKVADKELVIDLLLLYFQGFDVILGMN